MSTVMPKGDKIKQAIKWISEKLKEDETQKISLLIQDASREFNLSPADEQFLMSFYQKK